ncbi:MAG TPA: hypothetical protein VFB60_27390 [Ktedonobacteraceae bacterium]|nr:hypothetical protein [Ktedonobacteraceae bacterium]
MEKVTANENSGPFLAAAMLCEKVLQEKDETISVIRMVDRLVITVNTLGSPETMPSTPISLYMLIALKSGTARGRGTIGLRAEAPTGLTIIDQLFPVLFEGEDRGTNLIINLSITLEQEGVYWFNILLEERFLTRVPLRVLYQRIGPNI